MSHYPDEFGNARGSVTEGAVMIPDTLSAQAAALAVEVFLSLPIPVAAFVGNEEGALWNEAWRRSLGEEEADRRDIEACLQALGIQAGQRGRLLQDLAAGCALESGPEHIVTLPDGRSRVWQFGSALLPDGGLCIAAIDVTERRREEEETERMAYLDALTGLPNRRLFDDRLNQAIERLRRGNAGFAVHFLDLDHFKQVNDSLGHAAGDRLLQQVARRLATSMRRSDTVARFGGDEFGVIQTDISDTNAAASLAGKLIQRLARPFHIGNQLVSTGASIGVATAFHVRDIDAARLMQAADIALYRVKQHGRGSYAFATAEETGQSDNPHRK